MSLALVMIAVAVLPAALAATATCTAPLMAVNGVPDKCFWYAYLDVPMTVQFLIDLCQKGSEAFGREGKLFRPRSRGEFNLVNITMIPGILQNDIKGVYPVDFFHYQQYGQSVWATLTYPFELMAPGMWAPGEPNNWGGNEKCVYGGYGGNYGLNDMNCDSKQHSVICEFPSEN